MAGRLEGRDLAGEKQERDEAVRVDAAEFNAWMVEEQKRVFLLCRRMLQDPEEADSATQDAFFKAYKAFSGGQGMTELNDRRRWITRIAVNTCLDRLRSKAWKVWQKRPKAVEEQTILDMTASRSPNAEQQLFAKEIQRRLEASLAKLSGRQRAVFSLRHYDGLAIEEIAEVLKLDAGTIKAHLFRAVSKLREELKDLYGARVA